MWGKTRAPPLQLTPQLHSGEEDRYSAYCAIQS